MAPTARLPPKKDVALALLEQASMYIHLDPRSGSVQVPPGFKNQPQLVLQVGLNMAVAIPDLHVDDQGLSCTLSFNRTPFFCMIPWPAVFALVGENGQAMVWAEDVPAEVAAQAQAQKAPEKPRPHLRSVGEGEGAAPAAAKAEPAPEKKPAAKASKTPAKSSASKAEASKGASKAAAKPKAEAKASTPKSGKNTGKAQAKTAKTAEPAAAKSPGAAPVPKPEPAVARQTAAKKPAASKPETSHGTPDSNKPKRELPPYLRVVK
ncbi:MAG TPA: ClpXP protease specificity-enhancing factor SspB [Polyangiaceae bacterium]|nr:ClpXP protease specificity-enhancing factor SspB [Polyangiaceae bacterium]